MKSTETKLLSDPIYKKNNNKIIDTLIQLNDFMTLRNHDDVLTYVWCIKELKR